MGFEIPAGNFDREDYDNNEARAKRAAEELAAINKDEQEKPTKNPLKWLARKGDRLGVSLEFAATDFARRQITRDQELHALHYKELHEELKAAVAKAEDETTRAEAEKELFEFEKNKLGMHKEKSQQ
jgi:hypothetical protein